MDRKRAVGLGISLMAALILGACSNTSGSVDGDTAKNLQKTVDSLREENKSLKDTIAEFESQSETDINAENENASTKNKQNKKTTVNQVVADNENFKATLTDVKYLPPQYDGDSTRYEIDFDVENKRGTSIEVQSRELSINDRMVDESLQGMSTTISGGKTGIATLTLESYSEDNPLPEVKGKIDMILHVFDSDDTTGDGYSQDEQISVQIP